jgi:hypothetical protein
MRFYDRKDELNDIDKKILIADVKMNPERISIEALKRKSKKLLKGYQGYHVQYLGLSLNDLDKFL